MTNQSFPIIYNDACYMVDASLMRKNSRKFDELIKSKDQDFNTLCLKFSHDDISSRNLNNFLNMCQDLPVDIQDKDKKEICLLAKIFQADKIYDINFNYIKNNMNSNFSIPKKEYDEHNFLILEPFDKNTRIQYDLYSDDSNSSSDEISSHSVCYQIIEDVPFLKLARFYFMKSDQVLYTAKIKKNHFYIGEGKKFHINENAVQIICDKDDFNQVITEDQKFAICFVRIDDSYSIDVSFINKGIKIHWMPKDVQLDSEFEGEHKRNPIQSKRNIILKNSQNQKSLIIRKMSNKVIEVECNPDMNPIIIFSIALSHIIGPVLSGYNLHKFLVN